MKQYYIGQEFYYKSSENRYMRAKLIKVAGNTLYFRNTEGQAFKGSKYFVGQTIFPSIKPRQENNKNVVKKKKPYKFKKAKRDRHNGHGYLRDKESYAKRDRRSRYQVFEDNRSKPGLQKEDDWSKYDYKIPNK